MHRTEISAPRVGLGGDGRDVSVGDGKSLTAKEGAARQDGRRWYTGLRRATWGREAGGVWMPSGVRGDGRSRCSRPRSGRTNTNTELRSGMHALDGLGRPMCAGRGAAQPEAGRLLPSLMAGKVAACTALAARPDAKAPGPGWGLERRPCVRSRRPERPAHCKSLKEPDGLLGIINVVSVDAHGADIDTTWP